MRQMGLADARASLSPGAWERNFSRGPEYSLEEALGDARTHPTEIAAE